MCLKRALFKPAGFFKGLIFVVGKDASSKEAIIIGSIINKMSIPIFHAEAAMIKLSEMPYSLGIGYFMKILLGKNYSLSGKVLGEGLA